MAEINTSRTYANLVCSVAREMMASRRYLACASSAEQEHRREAAVLFRYISARRKGHAEAHLSMLDTLEDARARIGSDTAIEHLRDSIAHALHESTVTYPMMARTARDEGFDEIAGWFDALAEASRAQACRFEQALEATQSQSVGFGT